MHPAERAFRAYPASLPLKKSWYLSYEARRTGVQTSREIGLTPSEFRLGQKIRQLIWETSSFEQILQDCDAAGISVKPYMKRDKSSKELSFISLTFQEGLFSVSSSQIGVKFDLESTHPRNPTPEDMSNILRLRSQALERERERRAAMDEVTQAIQAAYDEVSTAGEVILKLRSEGIKVSAGRREAFGSREFYGESNDRYNIDLMIEHNGHTFFASETKTPLTHYRKSERAYDRDRDAEFLTMSIGEDSLSPA